MTQRKGERWQGAGWLAARKKSAATRRQHFPLSPLLSLPLRKREREREKERKREREKERKRERENERKRER
jgi:hypothetical protein